MYEHDKRGFYRLLECTPNTSSLELKRKYRRLALNHHPDRERDPDRRRSMHERMQSLNQAYETLRDTERRSRYDQECGFPRCKRHPATFLSGRCSRCEENICPECTRPQNGRPGDSAAADSPPQADWPPRTADAPFLCLSCRERAARRHRLQDPVERALLALEDGELDLAHTDLREALLVNPRDVVALTALATVREKKGDLEGAVTALRLALQVKPDHALSHYRLGIFYQRLGHKQEAGAAYEEALRLSPGNPKYRGAMAVLLAEEPARPEPRFRPNDPVKHEVFGAGVVTEVTPVGVRVNFGDGGFRWLDPIRAPMVHRAL